MGQPRPEEETLSEPEWLARFAAEYRKVRHTPPLQMRLPISEADQLALEAARAHQQAIVEGRATPRPAPPPEQQAAGARAATPESLERHREAGRERARARLARMAGRSIMPDDSDESE
jgi:hypothetical protein